MNPYFLISFRDWLRQHGNLLWWIVVGILGVVTFFALYYFFAPGTSYLSETSTEVTIEKGSQTPSNSPHYFSWLMGSFAVVVAGQLVQNYTKLKHLGIFTTGVGAVTFAVSTFVFLLPQSDNGKKVSASLQTLFDAFIVSFASAPLWWMLALCVFVVGGYEYSKRKNGKSWILFAAVFVFGVMGLITKLVLQERFEPVVNDVVDGVQTIVVEKSQDFKNGKLFDKNETEAKKAVPDGCERVTLDLQPGVEATFVRNHNCRNLDWLREDGPVIYVTLIGSAGKVSHTWQSGMKIPAYEGIVDLAKLTNAGEKPVLVEFHYKH